MAKWAGITSIATTLFAVVLIFLPRTNGTLALVLTFGSIALSVIAGIYRRKWFLLTAIQAAAILIVFGATAGLSLGI